jgi:hypothetical protein
MWVTPCPGHCSQSQAHDLRLKETMAYAGISCCARNSQRTRRHQGQAVLTPACMRRPSCRHFDTPVAPAAAQPDFRTAFSLQCGGASTLKPLQRLHPHTVQRLRGRLGPIQRRGAAGGAGLHTCRQFMYQDWMDWEARWCGLRRASQWAMGTPLVRFSRPVWLPARALQAVPARRLCWGQWQIHFIKTRLDFEGQSVCSCLVKSDALLRLLE